MSESRPPRATFSTSIVFLAMAFLLVLAAGSPAAESRALTFPEDGFRVFDTALTVDRAGRATLAWAAVPSGAPAEVHFVSVDPDGSAGAVRTLPAGEAVAPEIDLAADRGGTVTMVYTDSDARLRVVRLAPDGTPGEVVTLGAGDEPRVLLDRAGTPTVFWRSAQGLSASRLEADGAPGPVSVITEDGPYEYDVAFDRRGTATVALATGRFSSKLSVLRVPPGSRMRPEPALSWAGDRDFGVRSPDVDVAPDGAAAIAWSAERQQGGPRTILSARVGPGGQASPVRDVTNGAERIAATPRVLATSDGTTVAWSSRRPGNRRSSQILVATTDDHGRRTSRARPVSPAKDARDPRIVASRAGDVVITWRSRPIGDACIASRRITAAGATGPVRLVRGSCPASSGPEAGLDRSGGLALAWTGTDVRLALLASG